MFATVPRMRTYRLQQQEQRPDSGTGTGPAMGMGMGDSNYGVRSLGSEADWGGSSFLEPECDPEATSGDQNENEDEEVSNEHDEGEGNRNSALGSGSPRDDVMVPGVDESGSGSNGLEETPTMDRASLPPQSISATIPPPSPSPSPALGHGSTSITAEPHDHQHQHQPEYDNDKANDIETDTGRLSLSHAYLFEERDNLSQPSSPASFASMPSYMSSLSRTSSLVGVEPSHRDQDHDQAASTGLGYGMGMGGSEELVMPLLNVSQATGSRWARTPRGRGGIKAVILGDEARKADFINQLQGIKEVVEISNDEYGIIGGDQVIATLSTGMSADDVETRIEAAYTALDGVLHPNPSPGAQGQIQQLVADYASKSDWIHLLFVLDAETSTVDALAQLVPTLSTSTDTITPLLQLPPMHTSPTHSHPFAPDPTPRPNDDIEPASYFGTQSRSQSTDVHQFVHALAHIQQIQQASVTKFFTWRPVHRMPETQETPDLASSQTSHSSGIEAAPMPTVARAQGGGEWEANLSRRLAKRRQSVPVPNDSTASTRHNNGPTTVGGHIGKRKSSTTTSPSASAAVLKKLGDTRNRRKAESQLPGSTASCGPLFPPIPSSDPFGPSGKLPQAGLGDILEKTFGSLRKRWRWGVVAATALVFVVGWNWVKGV